MSLFHVRGAPAPGYAYSRIESARRLSRVHDFYVLKDGRFCCLHHSGATHSRVCLLDVNGGVVSETVPNSEISWETHRE